MCCLPRGWKDPRAQYAVLVDPKLPVAYFFCSTCAANSPVCPTCGAMAWQSKSQARWNQTMQLHVGRLGKHINDVNLQLDFHTFDIFLKDLEVKCSKGGLGRLLSPNVLSHVEQFTSAISSMTQANTIACLVWGSLQAVLKVAYSFSSILSNISEMLSDITNTLPMTEEYRNLLPSAWELEEPLRELYNDYVNFCIDTFLFFKSKRWALFRKLTYGGMRTQFEAAKASIAKNTLRFNNSVDLARTRLGVAANEHVLRLTDSHARNHPVVKGIPFQQNSRFIGRENELRRLHDNLNCYGSNGGMRQLSCTIHGIGGVGKTQLALEYTYRYRHEYSHIFWVRAESDIELTTSFASFAQDLMPSTISQDQNRNVEMVRDWMVKNTSWLLVFDNVDEAKLSSYWPPTSHGSIIITTQRKSMVHQTSSDIELEVFEEEEGSELILNLIDPSRRESSPKTVEITKRISNELGGLPLLLSHVAGFADGSKCPLPDLLTNLQQPTSFKKIWAYDSTTSTNFQYGEPMAKVWRLALHALSPEALATLHIMAMLNPDSIPEELLIGDWGDGELSFLSPSRRFDFNEIRQSLTDRHLVTASTIDNHTTLSMHRALKNHILHLIDEKGEGFLEGVFRRALAMVRCAYPKGHKLGTPMNDTWKDCEQCLPHVYSLLSVFQTWNLKIEACLNFATVLCDTAKYMWERGLIREGIMIMDAGEDVCYQLSTFEEVPEIHANICAFAGGIYAEIGFSGRTIALEKCEKALELRQKRNAILEERGTMSKEDALMLANSWNDVGVVKIQNEEFESAVPCLEEALRLKREWSSEEEIPWHFGEAYKNLAFVRLSQGLVKEAQDFARRAAELCSRDREEKSAATQKARFVLATILLNSHEQEEAFRMHKKILQARVEVFGEAHPATKDSIYTIGEIYRLRGKLDKAEYNFRAALDGCELWSEEATARAKYHLALTIQTMPEKISDERAKEASKLLEEAKDVREKHNPSNLPHQTPEDALRMHDFMVSLWAGRMGFTGPSKQELKMTASTV